MKVSPESHHHPSVVTRLPRENALAARVSHLGETRISPLITPKSSTFDADNQAPLGSTGKTSRMGNLILSSQ